MPSKRLTLLLAGGLIVVAAVALRAQSLGDVAKKEEERRKNLPAGAKVYTNKDLPSVPASAGDPAADKDSDKAGDKAADPDKADKADSSDKSADKSAGDNAAADKAGKNTDGAKDQKYWRERIEAGRLALDRDSGYVDAMQTRVNALTTDFVNRDDPSQRGVIERDRQRALSELDRLKKQVVDDKKAISDIEDEARRAGVPPGWLR